MNGNVERQRGFALLIVLWALGLLALLGTQLVATARERTQLARNLRDAGALQAATDGAVQHTIFELLNQSAAQWNLTEPIRRLRIGSMIVTVRTQDESGKVNPNIASVDLLRALLVEVGADPRRAAAVATAIVDWRSRDSAQQPYVLAGRDYAPPGAAFLRIDELGLVLGMTPDLLARLRPHLTLFTDSDPDVRSSDPVVARALQSITDGAASVVSAANGGVQVDDITAIAHGPDNTSYAERVVVRINASDGGGYEILASDPLLADHE